MAATAGAVPAFRADISGTPRHSGSEPQVGCAAISARADTARHPHFRAPIHASQWAPAMESGSPTLGILHSAVRGGGGGASRQLPAREHSHPPPAAEVDHARHNSRDYAVYAALRSAVSVWRDALHGDEGLGAVAGAAAADLRIRHLPLSTDGRRPNLQAWHGLHDGGCRHRGSLLRSSG